MVLEKVARELQSALKDLTTERDRLDGQIDAIEALLKQMGAPLKRGPGRPKGSGSKPRAPRGRRAAKKTAVRKTAAKKTVEKKTVAKKKTRKKWSPEARAAQAERIKKQWESRRKKKRPAKASKAAKSAS